MNDTVFKAGKRYERMVLILALAFLVLCIGYAFLYVLVLRQAAAIKTFSLLFHNCNRAVLFPDPLCLRMVLQGLHPV